MFALLVPYLAPLLGKVSLQTLKWIAGGVLLLTVGLAGFIGGHRWEAAAFESYKAKAAAHELALQESYDRIGGDEAATYLAAVERDQAETQRQLDGMKYAPPIPAPPGLPTKGGKRKIAPLPDDGRIVRVLRDAAVGRAK